MSKLDVENYKIKLINAPQLSVESLDRVIEKGRKINYLRCLEEPEIKDCNCLEEKEEFSKKFYVCKILYPTEEKKKKYPECDHANDLVPNRDVFTREKYMEFLATPKKCPKPQMPRWIRKSIPPATVYVRKLAQPRHRILMETFKQNCSHFSIFQIETIANNFYREKFNTPQQAINEMKQKLNDHQNHVRHQTREIKKLKKKIEKCNEFNVLAGKLTKVFREFMIKEQQVDVCSETKQLASFTQDYLSNMFKSAKIDKNHSDVLDKVIYEFSNKFAWVMFDVTLKNASKPSFIHHADKCLDKLKKLCLPLQEFYPEELSSKVYGEFNSQSDESSSDNVLSIGTEEEVEFNDAIAVVRERLSFLTPSKINISPEDCTKLNENLTKVQDAIISGVIKASASKRSVKSLPFDDVDGLAELKGRKKKKNKKKKGKKKNEKCFGKRDIKPQWAIEWREKADEGICKNKN